MSWGWEEQVGSLATIDAAAAFAEARIHISERASACAHTRDGHRSENTLPGCFHFLKTDLDFRTRCNRSIAFILIRLRKEEVLEKEESRKAAAESPWTLWFHLGRSLVAGVQEQEAFQSPGCNDLLAWAVRQVGLDRAAAKSMLGIEVSAARLRRVADTARQGLNRIRLRRGRPKGWRKRSKADLRAALEANSNPRSVLVGRKGMQQQQK